ncbi:MAG: phosphomannomutase [Candidatus Devosia phytovorans]|uniref:Phosphomannomutase n=1 Tax=Candidatus Devosia phytovorans TaxID=3121372 RepID=A0AAJ5VXE1_9HYPH|nr:phosphomannomutase [Devosia sp.]WEK05670.1 MAG: phosphomannomutase [Devosia sp.]
MSSLKFGTSGLRGLAVELEGQAARRYTAAFLRHLAKLGQEKGGRVYLGQDFRPSSPAIVADCAAAIAAAGLEPVDCGTLPTPALALHAMAAGCAAIMVTGSHIPADRNGLKFYVPAGEISKADEAGILAALNDESVPDLAGAIADEADAAMERYFERFSTLLPEGAFAGLRIGVFEHSTVARDLLTRILGHYGAETVSLGRIDGFVPIDTEAFGDAVFEPLKGWIDVHNLDAIVSADGDGDRPLLMDAAGEFVRGDVLGLLTARYLGARVVVTPVTSNSAIERTGSFAEVVRTKVGSPYVVAGMETATGSTIGFEANGGTFVGNGVSATGEPLPALPTRDAVLPLLCVLALAAGKGIAVSELVRSLPLQHALADRLQDVPSEKSGAFLARLAGDAAYAEAVFVPHGIADLSTIDGLQFRTTSGDMVHFRASGNAPELRCYVEGSSPEVARELLAWGMAVAAREVG